MIQIKKYLIPLFVAGLLVGCGGGGGDSNVGSGGDGGGGDGGSGGSGGSGGGTNTGCITSAVSAGAYFKGSVIGLEGAQQTTTFNANNIDTGCGGLGFGAGYSMLFQLADPGDPNDAKLNFKIDIADDAIPEVMTDRPATVLLTLPLSNNPGRGGFFDGEDCLVSITATPEESGQQGGRFFYPEGTFTCSRFTLNPLSAALTGPQPDIILSPSTSVFEFLGGVGITSQ